MRGNSIIGMMDGTTVPAAQDNVYRIALLLGDGERVQVVPLAQSVFALAPGDLFGQAGNGHGCAGLPSLNVARAWPNEAIPRVGGGAAARAKTPRSISLNNSTGQFHENYRPRANSNSFARTGA
jgi:hypothetical protein